MRQKEVQREIVPTRSISPSPSVAPVASSIPKLPLPPPPKSSVVPSKPRGPSPTFDDIKPRAPHFTSEKEADAAAQIAMQNRIHLLPNQQDLKDKLGKSTEERKTFTNGLMNPTGPALNHPAAPMLEDYAKYGCPVDCGPDWTREQIEAALDYGAHPTAKVPQALECLIKEAEEKEKEGFVHILRWGDIKHNLHPRFKLSPVAMIPHKSRLFRAILDLSFYLRKTGTDYKSVNDTTVKMANPEAMDQLGKALLRIIAALADAQAAGKQLFFAKLDIKDGFWRMIVSDADAWNFCYAIPNADPAATRDDTRIVVPNSLQMGWCESPPFFCAASETARDVIQQLLKVDLPPHPLEHYMMPANNSTLPTVAQDLLNMINLIEVFVDDFIGCTDNLTKEHLLKFTRAMMHGMHSIFSPPSQTGHTGGDPISIKKLKQLEGLWEHVKEILGWILDGANYTINLPPKKVEKIQLTLRNLKKKNRLPLNDYQKIAGTLHHASMGIPGGRGLFTAIWAAMKGCKKNGWIALTKDLKAIFADFGWLFREIANKPINVAQLVPTLPNCHGYCDSCKRGAGGVWILPGPNGTPRYVFWSVDFPPEIVAKMATHDITINDLEMAGVLLEWLVLECNMPSLSKLQAGIQCDNTSSVHWTRKYSAKSLVAGHLLRALALRQQICGSAPLLVISIEGALNDMADVASRYSTTKSMQAKASSLLSYFNTYFPQDTSWEQYHLPQKLLSRVISSLLGKQLTLESWRRLPGLVKNIGKHGSVTQIPSTSTRFSKEQTPSSETWSLQHSLLGSGKVTTAKAVKSKYKPSLTRWRPSARPSNWLDTKAPSTELTTSITSKSSVQSKDGDEKTRLPSPN